MKTEWRTIPNWPDYLVADDGNVFYLTRDRMLVLSADDRVTLYREADKRAVNPGNLVLEAFVGLCPDGMECCHIDDDRRNNILSNLRWGTREQNMADRKRNGLIPHTDHLFGENANHVKMTEQQVLEAKWLREEGWTWAALGKRYGVTGGGVARAVKGKTWKHLVENR